MDLTKGLKTSNYYHFHINFDSDYKWGRGWTENERNNFEREVYPKFDYHGYYIIPSKNSIACPSLHKQDSELNVYMHPMSFSGIAEMKDIDKIYHILQEINCIYYVQKPITKVLYDVSDANYLNILTDHSKEILEFLKEVKKSNMLFDAEFIFMKKFRIPRITDKAVLNSDDLEYKFIHSFKRSAEVLGLL